MTRERALAGYKTEVILRWNIDIESERRDAFDAAAQRLIQKCAAHQRLCGEQRHRLV